LALGFPFLVLSSFVREHPPGLLRRLDAGLDPLLEHGLPMCEALRVVAHIPVNPVVDMGFVSAGMHPAEIVGVGAVVGGQSRPVAAIKAHEPDLVGAVRRAHAVTDEVSVLAAVRLLEPCKPRFFCRSFPLPARLPAHASQPGPGDKSDDDQRRRPGKGDSAREPEQKSPADDWERRDNHQGYDVAADEAAHGLVDDFLRFSFVHLFSPSNSSVRRAAEQRTHALAFRQKR
jgi:hypothetical protein